MATNCTINGSQYYKIKRKTGKVLKGSKWVDKYKTFYGKNKKEAEQKYQTYLNRLSTASEDRKCLGELMDIFINEVFKKSSLE